MHIGVSVLVRPKLVVANLCHSEVLYLEENHDNTMLYVLRAHEMMLFTPFCTFTFTETVFLCMLTLLLEESTGCTELIKYDDKKVIRWLRNNEI